MTRNEAHELVMSQAFFDDSTVEWVDAEGNFSNPFFELIRKQGNHVMQGDPDDLAILLDLQIHPHNLVKEMHEVDRVDYFWVVRSWVYAWMTLRPETALKTVSGLVQSQNNWQPLLAICREAHHTQVFHWVALILSAAAEQSLLSTDLKDLAYEVLQVTMREVSLPSYNEELKTTFDALTVKVKYSN